MAALRPFIGKPMTHARRQDMCDAVCETLRELDMLPERPEHIQVTVEPCVHEMHTIAVTISVPRTYLFTRSPEA